MDRVAVFVDAGYVFAQGSVLLAGRKLPRADTSLAHDGAVKAFSDFAARISGVPLAPLQDVKVRLGFVNSAGEQ